VPGVDVGAAGVWAKAVAETAKMHEKNSFNLTEVSGFKTLGNFQLITLNQAFESSLRKFMELG
jgi:hypothetical protein